MKVAVCSISSRMGCLRVTIQSLLKQSVPCEIHVLLSEEPFLLDKGFAGKQVPDELKDLPVTIHWVPNWASYRKNVSFMKLFPEDVFLAIDDDEEFHPEFMKFILDNYKGGVMAFRAARYSDQSYIKWEDVREPAKGIPFFHKGNGGVVYDAKLFTHPEFFNEKIFLEVAPTNDDIWVNFYRMYKQIPVQVFPIQHNSMPQPERLWFMNEHKNDQMIEKVRGIMNQMIKNSPEKSC